jgi:hypothetical protein
LLLNHVSRRYRERDLIAEARSVFPEAYVVRDFDHFVIRRGASAVKHTLMLPQEDEPERGA